VPPCATASGLVRLSVPIHAVVAVKRVLVELVNVLSALKMFVVVVLKAVERVRSLESAPPP
jgi:hypothetical protein